MKTKIFKIGLIGLGHQSTSEYVPGIEQSKSVELSSICDVDERLVKDLSQKLGVRGYIDYKRMINEERLDFVIVATPHDSYAKIVSYALLQGVHVLKEKPIAMSLDEARYLEQMCKKSDTQLMVALQRRFNPLYGLFFNYLDLIGKPFFIDSKYTLFVRNPHDGWRGDRKKAGGGCIIDMGYHMIDLIIWYFGLPDNIQAEISHNAIPNANYDAEDTAHVLFSYNNGLHGSFICSRYYPPKTEYIKVIGDNGMIEVERNRIRLLNNDGKIIEEIVRENTASSTAINQIDYFCQVIRGEKENIGSAKYHLKHMAFVEACYESKTNKQNINPYDLVKGEKRYEKISS